MRFALLLEGQSDDRLRHGEPGDSADCGRRKAVRVYLGVVCLCGGRECDRPRLLLEKQRREATSLRAIFMGLVRCPKARTPATHSRRIADNSGVISRDEFALDSCKNPKVTH